MMMIIIIIIIIIITIIINNSGKFISVIECTIVNLATYRLFRNAG